MRVRQDPGCVAVQGRLTKDCKRSSNIASPRRRHMPYVGDRVLDVVAEAGRLHRGRRNGGIQDVEWRRRLRGGVLVDEPPPPPAAKASASKRASGMA